MISYLKLLAPSKFSKKLEKPLTFPYALPKQAWEVGQIDLVHGAPPGQDCRAVAAVYKSLVNYMVKR